MNIKLWNAKLTILSWTRLRICYFQIFAEHSSTPWNIHTKTELSKHLLLWIFRWRISRVRNTQKHFRPLYIYKMKFSRILNYFKHEIFPSFILPLGILKKISSTILILVSLLKKLIYQGLRTIYSVNIKAFNPQSSPKKIKKKHSYYLFACQSSV